MDGVLFIKNVLYLTNILYCDSYRMDNELFYNGI